MQRHSENAQAVAEFLESHHSVSKTIYPGLISHPQHDIAKKQMNMFGGMVTLLLGGLSSAKKLRKFEVSALAESRRR